MRYRFAREGVPVLNQIFFEPGALTFVDELPIVWSFRHDIEGILGRATDIRREEDGWLTAECEWKGPALLADIDKMLEHKEVEITIYVNELTEHVGEDWKHRRHILAGRVRELSVVIYGQLWEEVK